MPFLQIGCGVIRAALLGVVGGAVIRGAGAMIFFGGLTVGVVFELGLVVVGVVVFDCANAAPMKETATPIYKATCATVTTKLALEFVFISELQSTDEHREDLPYCLEHPIISRLSPVACRLSPVACRLSPVAL
jgi:hypothetical protein